MMRQATHCFEPQRKAFGRQYVMPLYLVYFSCACHPSDLSLKTFVGACGSIDSITLCCQCTVKIKMHFLVPQIEALQHCLCALACACFFYITWSQSPCPIIIKLGGTAKYSKTGRFSEAMTRKAENIGSLRSKIGKFTFFFGID